MKLNTDEDIENYLRYRYLFIGSILLFILFASLYLSFTVPQYRINSKVIISNKAINSSQLFTDIKEIKSGSLLLQAITQLNLQVSYYTDQKFNAKELYGSAVPIKVIISDPADVSGRTSFKINLVNNKYFILEDDTASMMGKFNHPFKRYGLSFTIRRKNNVLNTEKTINVKINDLSYLTQYYNDNLVAVPLNSRDSSGLLLSLLETVPERGMLFQNALLKLYVHEIKLSNRHTAIFYNPLNDIKQKISVTKEQIQQFKTADSIKRSGKRSTGYNELRQQLAILNAFEPYVNNSINQFQLLPTTFNLKDTELKTLVSHFNQLQVQKQHALTYLKSNDGHILSLNKQLSNNKNDLLRAITNKKGVLTIGLEGSKKNYPAWMKQVLPHLNQQLHIQEELYVYYKNKNPNSALLNSPIAIVKPYYNRTPENPRPLLLYFCAVICGILVPVPFIYGREALSSRIQTLTDIKKLSDLDTIALNSNFEKFIAGKGYNTFLITSSVNSEGKTFVSKSFGKRLAVANKKTIIVDFDLRKPGLLKSLGINESAGVDAYIINEKINIQNIITPSATHKNLSFIGGSKIPEPDNNGFFNNMNNLTPVSIPGEYQVEELILMPKFAELITYLKTNFDYIIFDCPSLNQPADVFPLIPFADVSLIIVKQNFTLKKLVGKLNKLVNAKRLKKAIIVLNT